MRDADHRLTSLVSTSVIQARGSTALSLQVSTSGAIVAQFSAPRSWRRRARNGTQEFACWLLHHHGRGPSRSRRNIDLGTLCEHATVHHALRSGWCNACTRAVAEPPFVAEL